MSPALARAVGLLGAFVLGLGAVAALDAAGIASFVQRPWAPGLISLAVATLSAALWPLLLRRGLDRARVAQAVLVVGSAAFVVGRAPFGWLDLGPLGAGSPGEIPLVLLPLVSVVATALAWPAPIAEPNAERRAPGVESTTSL